MLDFILGCLCNVPGSVFTWRPVDKLLFDVTVNRFNYLIGIRIFKHVQKNDNFAGPYPRVERW